MVWRLRTGVAELGPAVCHFAGHPCANSAAPSPTVGYEAPEPEPVPTSACPLTVNVGNAVLCRHAVDPAFGDRGQFLVGRFFLVQVLLKERCAVIAPKLLRPCNQTAVTRDLVMLDRLCGSNQCGI